MKKILAIVLAAVLCFALVACGGNTEKPKTDALKVGFIFLHDENSTYDKNFIEAAEAACKAQGVEIIKKTNIPEGNECKIAAEELVDEGCSIVFADSFGHESYLLEVAKANPGVQFCHATGTMAHTAGVANFHNAFAAIYEGRYLAGVAAGMKLNEMIESGKITAEQAKMGYVGAFTYAEVISGYTSFYLGAKSVCPSVTMDVQFTGSWYDETAEKEAANTLISKDCVLISQHADSMGAPTACEVAGVPNVSYNGSTVAACPNTFIVSSKINWTPYFEYIITCVKEGKEIATDWTGTIKTGSVELTDINEAAAAKGTADKIAEVKADLEAGKIKVFDVSTFTVEGKALDTEFMADVDTDEAYTADSKVVLEENGVTFFSESGEGFRSAPYFNVSVDGITTLNSKF